MLNFIQIASLSVTDMALVAEFRTLFKAVHEFDCPEFDDFKNVEEFYSRLSALRNHHMMLAA